MTPVSVILIAILSYCVGYLRGFVAAQAQKPKQAQAPALKLTRAELRKMEVRN